MLDDFDIDFPEEEDGFEEEEEAPEGRNRTFMLIAGGLGGLIIIALICVAKNRQSMSGWPPKTNKP